MQEHAVTGGDEVESVKIEKKTEKQKQILDDKKACSNAPKLSGLSSEIRQIKLNDLTSTRGFKFDKTRSGMKLYTGKKSSTGELENDFRENNKQLLD